MDIIFSRDHSFFHSSETWARAVSPLLALSFVDARNVIIILIVGSPKITLGNEDDIQKSPIEHRIGNAL